MANRRHKKNSELPKGRLTTGAVIFIAGHSTPLWIPLVAASSLPDSWKTAAVRFDALRHTGTSDPVNGRCHGQSGIQCSQGKSLGLGGPYAVARESSRPRYYAGLVLFLIPFFIGWISPYVFEIVPELTEHQLIVAITGDLMLLLGLCLMGGQFWDKLRSLFIYDAEVTTSQENDIQG